MYSLVGQIAAHEGAVRSLACQGESILSGGADAFVRIWSTNTPDLLQMSLSHNHSVTAIAIDSLHEYILTGCMDNTIQVFNFKYQKIIQLEGHMKGVISLTLDGDLLISGSWDGCARVWDLKTFECIRMFEGHENGVNVLALGEGKLITTSTGEAINNKPCNFRIRIWDLHEGTLLHDPIDDHEASIRCIAKVNNFGFITCSNDGTVKLYTYEGDLVDSMSHPPQEDGSNPFVMGVAVISHSDMEFVSVGEDGSAVVWKNCSLEQSIPHPCGLWCACVLPNGDFLTGGHDGNIRIFSKDSTRNSSESVRALQVCGDPVLHLL